MTKGMINIILGLLIWIALCLMVISVIKGIIRIVKLLKELKNDDGLEVEPVFRGYVRDFEGYGEKITISVRLNEPAISAIKNGESKSSIDFSSLVKALNCSIEDLFETKVG